MPETAAQPDKPPRTWRRMVRWVFGLLLASMTLAALSLFHRATEFCTTTSRGWPAPFVIFPCECWGSPYQDVAWFVDWLRLAANLLCYALPMAAVLAAVRSARSAGRSAEGAKRSGEEPSK